jgi:hypothetical protein
VLVLVGFQSLNLEAVYDLGKPESTKSIKAAGRLSSA